jgi:hypothetical protein
MPSRSAIAYLTRKLKRPPGGLLPSFSTKQLLIHQYPDPTGKPLSELIIGEGAPAPDRVVLASWSPPNTEET